RLHEAQYLPTPVQQPRIPIWVAAVWPHKKPFRRAAQWDGVCPLGPNGDLTPAECEAVAGYIREHRDGGPPFDMLAGGHTGGTDPGQDTATVVPFARAGVTWWQEAFDWNYTLEQVRARIHAGPPRL
ncbi:MAG TPA: LLM class flavin-dependent oxidoreductase, partial [Chloroflexia bacterium]|nr:LLM class flavin-dependent oxidoreductase [Chloroflexia bacterium]